MVRPCVARRFDELVVSGPASMYQTSDWSLAPGHHGYQRADELIRGKASTGHVGHQCSHALGRPNLHLVSSSRRPRRVTELLAKLHAACSLLTSNVRLPDKTPHAMRASLLASAIARTLRCSRFLAASIRCLSPCRSQLIGLMSTTQAACTNRTRR